MEVIPNNESTESIYDTVDDLFIDEPKIVIEGVPNPEIKTESSKEIPESSFIKIGNKIISRNVSDTRRR